MSIGARVKRLEEVAEKATEETHPQPSADDVERVSVALERLLGFAEEAMAAEDAGAPPPDEYRDAGRCVNRWHQNCRGAWWSCDSSTLHSFCLDFGDPFQYPAIRGRVPFRGARAYLAVIEMV